MCVAVPMRIKSVDGTSAILEAMGVLVRADVSLIPGAAPGDYVLVHAGFAIARVNEEEARETLECFAEIGKADPTKVV